MGKKAKCCNAILLGDGGLTLMSMWPKTRTAGEADHVNLANLAKQIVEMI